MTEYFKDFSEYKKERLTLIITYNAKKGSVLNFKNSRLSNLQTATIINIINQINSLENKCEYFDLANVLIKELSFRKLINGITAKKTKNNKKYSETKLKNEIIVNNILVDFYYYNHLDNEFNISKIETITISFVQTNKWYKFYILVNNIFTGEYMDFVAINSTSSYSPRIQIGKAYKGYIDGINLEYDKTNDIAKIPIHVTELFENILNNNIYLIKKYNRRDELTLLNLI